MFNKNEKNEIEQYLKSTQGRVYIGADSVLQRRFSLKSQAYENWARYAVVLVVHINDSVGCKIFSYTETERVYDAKLSKPRQRLLAETYKCVECYVDLAEVLVDRDIEIHLDINADQQHASNAIAKQAIGYVKGVTNLDAVIKPFAWAGSNTADLVARFNNGLAWKVNT